MVQFYLISVSVVIKFKYGRDLIGYHALGKMMNMAIKDSKNREEKIADAYIATMKSSTRAAIFDQLYRKPESTATEISKTLHEDVDVVYYHVKFLKKLGLVSEPRVEVRGNYIEKYYSLTPEAKESIAKGEFGTLPKKAEEMDPEEFRQILMAGFALMQSTAAGAVNQIKRADRDVIADLNKKRNFTIQAIRCTKERYYEILKNLREIARRPIEVPNQVELDYTIVYWALPKLGEE